MVSFEIIFFQPNLTIKLDNLLLIPAFYHNDILQMKGMDVVMVTEISKPELLCDRGTAKNHVLHFQHLVLQEGMNECVGDCKIRDVPTGDTSVRV